MEQRPSFLQHLVSGNAEPDVEVNADLRAVAPLTGKLAVAHRKWQATMAALALEPEGIARTNAFQTARNGYEEEMFDAALDAEICAE